MSPSKPTFPRLRAILLALAVASLAPARLVHAEAAAIFLDGTFGDWTGPVEHVDPADAGGVDLRELDLANDESWLFVRFQTTIEVALQEGSDLVLFLDTDANAGTGFPVSGIGAELRWNFGARNGCFYPAGSCVTIAQNAIRLRMLPSVTASTFEIAIARDARPDGVNALFTGPTIRVALVSNGAPDHAPNSGGLAYTFDATPVAAAAAIPFARMDAPDVRIVTWNTRDLESGAGYDPAVTPSADRVLSAIAPDIVCFQEVYNTTAVQIRTLLEGMLPERAPWYSAKNADCAVASRYPVLQSWNLDGNLAVLLDADAALDADLLLVCAHLPCCTNNAGRQNESDRIMAFFRDAKTPGGAVDVPAGTAFVIAGDLNLVGLSQQLRTLLTGDIVNQATFGADFAPDWDGTALADVISSQTERRFAYTWRSDGSPYAPGRLDFLIYTDAVLGLRRHFIVQSSEMSPAQLAATGIQLGDVTNVSDHLPHVADFRSVADLSNVGGVSANGFEVLGPALGRGTISYTLALGFLARVELEVVDLQGRVVRTIAPRGLVAPGRHTASWDGLTAAGVRAPSAVYFVRARARNAVSGAVHAAQARWILLR